MPRRRARAVHVQEEAQVPAHSGFEPDGWRILQDAQREADTVFAQYQLSQLLATGGTPSAMARAVLDELVRNTRASAGALWLARPGARVLELVSFDVDGHEPSVEGAPDATAWGVPATFPSAVVAQQWAQESDWFAVPLEESRDLGARGLAREAIGLVALSAGPDGHLADDHARLLALVRHELATALRASQLRDMSTRDRAMLRAILDGASDAIVAVDAHRRVVRLNPAASALLDVARPVGATCEEVLGCRRPMLIAVRRAVSTTALACGERCPFEEVLSSGHPIAGREREVPGRDGPVPVAANYARMPGEGGAVGVLRDLRPTRELDDLKSSFVAAISHELRMPLALISGYVQTLLHLELDPERQRHYLEQIQDVTERLTGLVNQILEIARLDSDRLHLERKPVALAGIVARAVTELGEGMAAPPIGMQIPNTLPPVNADEQRLQQVVANLLANAVKYGGLDVTITVRARRTDDGRVVVSVMDDGPGILADERAYVFERFFRGRSAAQSVIPGSGLGLYLCRRIMEAHGGAIWLDDVATGTSVSFSLPVVLDPGPHGIDS